MRRVEHLVWQHRETENTQNHTQSPDKGLAINGCLQSAAPPLVPPVTVVQPNKCLTLSKNPQATANTAPPSIYSTVCTVHAGNVSDLDLTLILIIFSITITVFSFFLQDLHLNVLGKTLN